MPTQQQQIDYGNTANDGQGDPLRTAFIKTDDNFDAIWAAGPVGSNVTIVNTTISTVNTNGNLILKPNGIGLVQANSHVVPNTANLRDLGSAAQRWRTLYAQSIDSSALSIAGNLTVGGDLTVEGNIIQIGNITTDSLTIQLANTAANSAQANGAGVTVGAADDIATLLYDSANNIWDTNIGIAVNGAITGTSLAVSDATIYGNVNAINGNFTGNVTANYFVGNGSQLTGITVVGGSNTQVQFNDAGVLSGNSLFTFNQATGNVHIDGFEIGQQTISGTTANANIVIHPNGSGALFIQGAGNALVHVQGDEPDTQNRVRIENYGANGAAVGGGEFQGQWTRGTPGAPQPAQTDDKLAQFGGRSWDGSAYGRSSGWISIDAAENWSNTSRATHISFWTTSISSVVPLETMRLGANGNLILYTGNLTVLNGQSRFLNTVNTHDILPTANGIYSLGNSSLYWSNLWVANNTIYIGGVPLGMTAGNVLTVNGNAVLTDNSNSTITTTGNITANYFTGNGSLLTGIAASTGDYTFTGTTMSADEMLIQSTDGDITIQSDSDIFADVTNKTFQIQADAGTWIFDGGSGATTPPILTVARGDTSSGTITGFALKIGDGTNEAIITTPDGGEGDPNSQRIVINPGKGADTSSGEGGDIYLWAGRGGDAGGSGGDVKIRGGQGMVNGAGGYIRMEGGDGQGFGQAGYITMDGGSAVDDSGGYLQFRGGYSQNNDGGYIEVRGGYSTNGEGGDVNIIGGGSDGGQGLYGNIGMQSGSQTWTFNNAGNLVLPSQGNIVGVTPDNTGHLQWVGNSSGDGGGYTTLRLVPDDTLEGGDQYLIIDPTGPTHIHIRAGGTQDDSAAALYLGGEKNYVNVLDGSGVRIQNETTEIQTNNYFNPADFTSGTWFTDGGLYYIQYTSTNAQLDSDPYQDINEIFVSWNSGSNSSYLTYGGATQNLGGGVYKVRVNEAPPAEPQALEQISYILNVTRNSYATLTNHNFEVSADNAVGIVGKAGIQLTSQNSTDNVRITTDNLDDAWTWEFGVDGNLTLPTNRSIIVDGGDGVIGPVSDDMVISWDNEEIRLVSVQGSIEMQADNAFRVQTNYNSGTSTYTSRWEFNQDEIVNITGPSSIVTEAGNLNLQGGRDTLSSGNVTVTAVNNGVSVNTWTFDNSGNLTAPGNITTTGNVTGDVGFFNDVIVNNAGTNALLYTNSNREIYDTAFAYDSGNDIISGSGAISTTGNISAGYFIGDGSLLTGLPASYSDSNVATFLAAYGSNTISTTGNITAGNFIGAGSNVELIAQSEQWVFDTTGVLTVPGNITGADVVSANTFVSNAFNVVTAGNLSITSQYGLGFTGTILEDNGTLELIGSGGGGAVVGWDSTYGNGLGNIATVNFNEVGGEGILLRTGNRAATEYNWNFDSTGNLTLPTEGYLLVQTGIIGAGASPAPTLSGFSSIATTGSPGNISASGNLLVSGYANITGSINGTNISLSGNITGNTAGFAIGYRDIPQVSFTGDATLAASDAGKHYYSTLATANILTIANNGAVSWPVGTAITVVNRGTGNITVAQASGVSLYLAGNSTSGNRIVTTYGMATLLNVAANVWMINGTGVS